ncbi:hypothetical protein T01_14176 [Trichinella spiralis]|uniref:Uncharacterized protein n=1 Tax=Trichinella spiralis TaxID=6334 RepID=A0A0V1AKY2_TRISP|nr:hypothetical protein T01_3165 [Trichinella spiralis]KRY25097.1 hypothetical protein T01_14176 [Trichinella spiralis]
MLNYEFKNGIHQQNTYLVSKCAKQRSVFALGDERMRI